MSRAIAWATNRAVVLGVAYQSVSAFEMPLHWEFPRLQGIMDAPGELPSGNLVAEPECGFENASARCECVVRVPLHLQ